MIISIKSSFGFNHLVQNLLYVTVNKIFASPLFSGLPGSVHDARVLRWSSIYTQQLYPPPGWYILGDGGYPCLAAPIVLLTPYREPLQNPVQARYNRHHSRARCVVERAIGMMKTRWRSIFLKALEVRESIYF